MHVGCSKLERSNTTSFAAHFSGCLKNKVVSLLVLQNKQRSKTAAAESDDDGRSTFYDFRCQIFMGTHKGH
jgi:hypothetical protein